MKIPVYFMMTVFFIWIAPGCKKNRAIDLKPDLNIANDQVIASRLFNHVFCILERAVTDSALSATHHAVIDGATVTLDPKGRKYTFSFPGGRSADSVVRGGVFVATFDSGFFYKGTTVRVAFQGYAEDGHTVTGGDSIICKGPQDGQYLYEDFITDAAITKDSLRSIRLSAGYQYSVSGILVSQGITQTDIMMAGKAEGTSSGGYPFTAFITKNLETRENCPWISDGIISLSMPGQGIASGTIEFMGKTGCNDQVTYDFDGNLYQLWMEAKYLVN